MENSKYLPIMIQSLKKKEQILDQIIQINQQQREELENPALDPDDFDKTFAKKAELIESLETLDNGFQELFERVRNELEGNKETYREEIHQMQDYIRRLTEKSADIQTQEARNKDLMQQKFATVRKQVKEVRKSQKVVNQYYKSMMKGSYMEPQFTDKKK
ncbi:MAG: flagellar export chaperone FlgN [Clostridiales bacterium]|nr:flagellar export chaperone FlgN [Roseburia sp.]MDD7636963.1 flagellar export chaperone FlgN [Clostridiales bacterium]MDY4112971.1 flagellar export chaperone FlgN [Roseburia sp.]